MPYHFLTCHMHISQSRCCPPIYCLFFKLLPVLEFHIHLRHLVDGVLCCEPWLVGETRWGRGLRGSDIALSPSGVTGSEVRGAFEILQRNRRSGHELPAELLLSVKRSTLFMYAAEGSEVHANWKTLSLWAAAEQLGFFSFWQKEFGTRVKQSINVGTVEETLW